MYVLSRLAGVWGVRADRPNPQGLDGSVTFTGSTPDLDDFTIRVEDGPENVYVDEASRTGDSVGRTAFAGYRVDQGNIWQAKSDLKSTGSHI
jgi:mannosyl-oligosaccharide glucosidase